MAPTVQTFGQATATKSLSEQLGGYSIFRYLFSVVGDGC